MKHKLYVAAKAHQFPALSVCQVVDDIVARGAKSENIRIVAVVCAPPAMVKLSEKYKGACPRLIGVVCLQLLNLTAICHENAR